MLTCKIGEGNIDTFSHKEEKLREWSNKSMLKCPVCGEKMLYCHGDYKIAYFRHEKSENCPDIYSEIVTQEHLKGIKILYDFLKSQNDIFNLELEKWIPETRQRPDIYFEKLENNIIVKYAIEFQCSPLATKYNERRDLYKLNNIKDIWILGTKKYSFINNNIDRCVYNNFTIYDYKTKTIEREIFNSTKTINYLNTDNGQIYQVFEFKNSERTRYSYPSGFPYKVSLETVFDIKMNTDYLLNYSFEKSLLNNSISNNLNCFTDTFNKTEQYIFKFFNENKSLDKLEIKKISENSNPIFAFKCNRKNFYVEYIKENSIDIKELRKSYKKNKIIPIIFTDFLIFVESNKDLCIIDINQNKFEIHGEGKYNDLDDMVFDGVEITSNKIISKTFKDLLNKYIFTKSQNYNALIHTQEQILLNAKKQWEIDKFIVQNKNILDINILLIDGYYTVPKELRFKYIKNYYDTEDFFKTEIINIIHDFKKKNILNINLMIEKQWMRKRIHKRNLKYLESLFKKYGFKNVSIYLNNEEVQ